MFLRSDASRKALGFGTLLLALLPIAALSVWVGNRELLPADIWAALRWPDDTETSMIVWSLRVPRTVTGLVSGAAFGVAGALMQALTRNPLADPGLLGVNAGAAFAVTLGVGVFGIALMSQYIWFAFFGAMTATVFSFLIGSVGRRQPEPAGLVLAGAALSAVLGGLTQLMSLLDKQHFQQLRAWGIGSLEGVTLHDSALVMALMGVGLLLALVSGRALNALALGDDLAAAMGVQVGRVRLLGFLAVTLLAGGGTALTGGLSFVGLMVPHLVRWLIGPDWRWIVLYSVPAAAALVVLADILGRVVVRPDELEAGIVTAVVGAPLLIALVRRREVRGL